MNIKKQTLANPLNVKSIKSESQTRKKIDDEISNLITLELYL